MSLVNQNSIKSKKSVVTLTKPEFLNLQKQAKAYRFLVSKIFELPFKDPVAEVVEDFRETDLYTDDFLNDLESGLRKSSYAKKHEG